MSELFRAEGLDETGVNALGVALAKVLRSGDRVGLIGELGAGKTTLARAILRALAENPALEVPSPTFMIVQDYDLSPPVRHVDLYRVSDPEELTELGLGEGDAIELIEWPMEPLPVTVELSIDPDDTRTATITGAPRRLARELQIARFLTDAGWGEARRGPLAADASARDYERLVSPQGVRAVLMDAPPKTPTPDSYAARAGIADGNPHAFLSVGGLLASRGFTTPEPIAADPAAGLLLLADLGDAKVADGENPVESRYLAAAEALAAFHNAPVSASLPPGPFGDGHTPPRFGVGIALTEVALFPQWALGREADPEFLDLWRVIIDGMWRGDDHLALRDVHSPNLMWCEEKEGIARIGFIDYQDAMIAPSAYDVVSLADDARLDMPAELSAAVVTRYLANRENLDEAAWRRTASILAAQRATRIVGVFNRLANRDGKDRYLAHIPRVAAALARSLDGAPDLQPLRGWFAAHAPHLVPLK